MRRINSALIDGLMGMAAIGGMSQSSQMLINASRKPDFDFSVSTNERKSSKRRRSRYDMRGW